MATTTTSASGATTVELTVTVPDTLAISVRALRNIVNVLGPEHICECEEQHCDGLAIEAADALATAREALDRIDFGTV